MSTAFEKVEKTTLKKKGQVTLPVSIRESLHLMEEDQLSVSIENGRIVLEPMITIPKDQAWFFTPEWQAGEAEAQAEIDAGKVVSFGDIEDALSWLDSED